MSKDWTQQLRDQLADYQEPVKGDLWAGIEQSLAQNQNSTGFGSKHTARLIYLRHFSVAAALAVLLVGGTYVYLHSGKEVDASRVASIVNSQGRKVAKNIEKSLSSSGNVEHLTAQNAAATSASWLACSLPKKSSASISEPTLLSDEITERTETSASVAENADTSRSRVEKQPRTMYTSPFGSESSRSSSNYLRHSVSRRGWSMQVYGGNGMMGNTDATSMPLVAASSAPGNPVYLGDAVVGNPVANFDAKLMAGMSEREYIEEVKHRQPISVGLQVGYSLTSRLSLATGLVYTYLSSDFIGSANDSRSVTTQKLHYLGIPVSLNYDVWGTQQVHTYMSVGGEGAVNIKNDTESEGKEMSSKRDRMQWSAQVAAGLQYDVVPQVGIYVEPGVKYYFDNGSQIENAFKDKKWNFNIQVGLRWNINK